MAHGSWPCAKRFQVAEFLRRLVRNPARLVGTADREEIAPGAGPLTGRRREETQLDRAIDDLERFETGATVLLVQRNRVIRELPRRGAIEQTADLDRLAQRLLDRPTVQDRLKDRTTAGERHP